MSQNESPTPEGAEGFEPVVSQELADEIWGRKHRRRRKKHKLAGESIGHLNLTPMMDIMTILLVFLIQSFATEPANINVNLDLRPPQSTANVPMAPATKVVISAKEIVVDDEVETSSRIIKYRKVKAKGKEQYQLVLNTTPFYAESGGQAGDTGVLESAGEKIKITDTKKENNLIIHYTDKIPVNMKVELKAKVDVQKRRDTMNNHTATHLLHASLREILGKHVEQKGSLVNDEYLRFDFSHFSKVTDEELLKIENRVNEKIRENISLYVKEMPIEEAKKTGAMALFGEKYGDTVRVVTFDKNFSIELCGGTHVPATGHIGYFKIISESAVAAGIRRIEAVTAAKAEQFINSQLAVLNQVKEQLKNPKDVSKTIEQLQEQNAELLKQAERMLNEKAQLIKADLEKKIQNIRGINFIAEKIDLNSAEAIKTLSFDLRNKVDNLFLVLGSNVNGKPNLTVMLADNLVKANTQMHAGNIVKELAKEINGGGGGQPFYATAGGTNLEGLSKAVEAAKKFV